MHKVRRCSVQLIKTTFKSQDGEEIVEEEKIEVPGSVKENVIETFKEPPILLHEEEDVDNVLDDGTVVQRKLKRNRMIQKVRTHAESFDSDHGRQVEDFVIDEIVPGTESVFLELEEETDSEESYEEDNDEDYLNSPTETEEHLIVESPMSPMYQPTDEKGKD